MSHGPKLAAHVCLLATFGLALTACGSGGGEATSGGEAANTAGGTESAVADLDLITDGTLVVGMSGEFQPFSFRENNELMGFDVDIAQALADEMGLELDAQSGAFDTLIQGLTSNRYDLLVASMSPTEERKQAVDFSDPYYLSGAQMFVRTDSTCEDPTQMDAPVIGVSAGTTYDMFINEQPWKGEVRTFSADATAMQDTELGRLDGTVTDKLVGLYVVEQARLDLRTCGDPLFTEEPAMAVEKGNIALLDAVNAALSTIIEDGTYAEISNTWFGQDILESTE